jgi:hypothetical protein
MPFRKENVTCFLLHPLSSLSPTFNSMYVQSHQRITKPNANRRASTASLNFLPSLVRREVEESKNRSLRGPLDYSRHGVGRLCERDPNNSRDNCWPLRRRWPPIADRLSSL